MEAGNDTPASPSGSTTPTQDEPLSPDAGPASPDGEAPASPDAPASLDGGGTPIQDEPASPDGSGRGTPTRDEDAADAPESPSPEQDDSTKEKSDTQETDQGPRSPSPTADADTAGPQSPKADGEDKAAAAGGDDDKMSMSGSSNKSDTEAPKSPDNKADEGDKSDIEDDGEKTTPSKKRIDSDSDSDDEGAKKKSGDDGDASPTAPAKRRLDSSSDEDKSDTEEATPKKKKRLESDESDSEDKKPAGSDDEAGSNKGGEEGGDAIADIFGDSSDEEGEFQGFDETEIKTAAAAAAESALPEEVSSDDELEDDQKESSNFVSDFDEMMARKKAERQMNRRGKRNVDIINDSDDLIVDMLRRMKEAAEEDRTLNQNHQPATRKLKMLPNIMRQLNKSELQTAFMDCGVLSALTEWLAPLPDKSLPHLSVRESLLKLLTTLPHPHTDQLKSSGIGKAVMYLFKHPKELRPHKEMAGRLINEWSRPIFGQSSNFKSVNREDLQKRDMQGMKKRRRSSDGGGKKEEGQQALRPGDPGWVYRARVPQPSNRDYVVRPDSNVDHEAGFKGGSSKKKKNRYEMQKQKMDNKKKAGKSLTAVKISIEGRNM